MTARDITLRHGQSRNRYSFLIATPLDIPEHRDIADGHRLPGAKVWLLRWHCPSHDKLVNKIESLPSAPMIDCLENPPIHSFDKRGSTLSARHDNAQRNETKDVTRVANSEPRAKLQLF